MLGFGIPNSNTFYSHTAKFPVEHPMHVEPGIFLPSSNKQSTKMRTTEKCEEYIQTSVPPIYASQ